MSPAFATQESLWPLNSSTTSSSQVPSAATAASAATESPAKSKPRHRVRRKPEASAEAAATAGGLAPPVPLAAAAANTASTSRGGPAPNAFEPKARNGQSTRGGRGRGGGRASSSSSESRRGGGPAGTRAFTTARGGFRNVSGNGGEDVGMRMPFSRRGGGGGGTAMGAQSADWRRNVHTDSAAATTSASDADGNDAPGQERRGKGETTKITAADKGTALLEQVVGMSDSFEEQILQLFELQRPSPAALAARQHLVDELTDWLNREHFRWGHAHNKSMYPLKIEPFGSVRFGLGTSTSDLDLCLLDPYRPNGFVDKYFSSQNSGLQNLPDIYNMRRIGRSLQQANLTDVRWIPEAAVPICKFKVMIDGHLIEADLNTNERLGVFNSRLINSYCNLHPLVRPLSVFIKFWAKQRGLNDPSGTPTTFSSYTFILLVIAYLQHVDLLPNLQDADLIASTGTERNRFFSTPKARARRSRVDRIVRSVGWDVTFVEYETTPEGYAAPAANLVDLARGFFHYYADEFDMERTAVSVWNGAGLERQRPFGTKKPVDTELVEALARNGDLSPAEVLRQREEDADLSAFAAEGTAAATTEPDLDSLAADLDALRQEDRAQHAPAEPNSRSSSPIEYEEYEEPERWADNLLVVQDPFILTRNCPGNVAPDWVEELRIQMRRARDLIDRNASIQEICAAVKDDPEYVSFADQKKGGKGRSRGGNNKRKPKPVRLKEKAEQQQAHDAENMAESAAPVDASEGLAASADAPEPVALVAPGSAAETTQAPLESADDSQKL
ncbi:hypothetical protein B0A53_05732 [Rhodotorula sp. CCFEE 5036]|nr:hypothetical protein B0A53_05732 [Rhodotorula sp. CCFEE 5036]